MEGWVQRKLDPAIVTDLLGKSLYFRRSEKWLSFNFTGLSFSLRDSILILAVCFGSQYRSLALKLDFESFYLICFRNFPKSL